jgi:predicted ATPase
VAVFQVFCREWQLAREQAEVVITQATEQGFPYWVAFGTIVRGRALAEQGQVEEGIAQMHQGLSAWRAMGVELSRIRLLPWLAAGYAKARQAEEGLNVLAEALDQVEKIDEHWNEADLYLLKGEITLAKSSVQPPGSSVPSPQPLAPNTQAVEQEAEECFLKAIEIAKKQQAKSLELRATTSLARLWQQQGKQKEAHQMLSEIYSWFTEGFDTKDLQEAKALLEELR